MLGIIESTQKATNTQKEFARTFELDTEEGLTAAIALLEENQKQQSIGGDEWVRLGEKAEEYRKILQRLKEEANFSIEDIVFVDDDFAQDAIDIDNFLNTEGIEFQAKLLADRLGQNQKDLISEFDSLYERDFQNFQEYAQRKLEAENLITQQRVQNQLDFLSTTQDFAQAFFEIQSNRIDDEIEKQNEAFDAIVNNKNSSEEQIRIVRS